MNTAERNEHFRAIRRQATLRAAPAPATSHPGRYPIHLDPAKGQVYDGECNRTACTNQHSRFWNLGTYGLYCTPCARAINEGHDNPLCVRVEEKPAVDDMAQLRQNALRY